MNNLSTDTYQTDLRVGVVGGSGVGLTMKVDRVPRPGETVSGATFSSGPGGKGSNQAVGIRRLGLQAVLLTSIGDDAHGRLLRELWQREGVDDTAISTSSLPTMVGTILVEASGENRIVVAPGALGEVSPRAISRFADEFPTLAALLVSLEIPLALAERALIEARKAEVPTILNAAPASVEASDLLRYADHLVPNRSEAAILAGLSAGDSPDRLVDGLRRSFEGVIVLTLGDEGALLDDGERRERIAAHLVDQVVDSTGAGDAFCAAYTVALVEGATPVEAARFGAQAGAFAVTRDEVVPALPRRSDLTAAVVTAENA